MLDVVLISCSGPKINMKAAQAQDMYNSILFGLNLKYGKLLQPNLKYIHILSAKHGVLNLDTIIEKYNLNIHDLTKE